MFCYTYPAGSLRQTVVEWTRYVPSENFTTYGPRHEKSKKSGKDQGMIQSSTTPDPGYQWESDKLTVRHHKREPRGQLFPSK